MKKYLRSLQNREVPIDEIGPDGLTERQRRIDPNPDHWRHPQGAPVDDSNDTKI